jgi:hypothetical protein
LSSREGRRFAMSARGLLGGRATAVVAVVVTLVLLTCAVLATLEMRYRSCIARAEAAYPAVPVSALTTQDTGPLKVSFVEERQRAIDECGRL